jgi:hypothetical protein
MTAVEGGAPAKFQLYSKAVGRRCAPRKWFYDSGIGNVALTVSSLLEPVSYLPDITQYK